MDEVVEITGIRIEREEADPAADIVVSVRLPNGSWVEISSWVWPDRKFTEFIDAGWIQRKIDDALPTHG